MASLTLEIPDEFLESVSIQEVKKKFLIDLIVSEFQKGNISELKEHNQKTELWFNKQQNL